MENSDWIEWKGGECPVDEGIIVDVKYRDDEDHSKGLRLFGPIYASRLAWWHDGQDDDIIAYRIVEASHAD